MNDHSHILIHLACQRSLRGKRCEQSYALIPAVWRTLLRDSGWMVGNPSLAGLRKGARDSGAIARATWLPAMAEHSPLFLLAISKTVSRGCSACLPQWLPHQRTFFHIACLMIVQRTNTAVDCTETNEAFRDQVFK
jgi:hypothetical protein